MSDTTADVSPDQKIRNGMDPSYKAGALIAGMRPFTAQSAHQIIDEIKRQIEAVRSGDLSRGKAMLVAQAEALDVLFYNFLNKAQKAEKAQDTEAAIAWLALAVKAVEGASIVVSRLQNEPA